uniref:Phage protein n=1 Tax=Citrobacter freundii TaxID=546 RepID=A0A0K2S3N5_CITFR|nr:ASCH domain-containing protein [Citrobacter freundii]BAS21714.1 phage protein [Citrobacter freundii]
METNKAINSTKKVLRLPVKAKYFFQIRNNEKPEEFRLNNVYWQKRLIGKTFDEVVITLGYPGREDTDRMIVRPWRGYSIKTISHEHFGNEPVSVFAIVVN